jgi:hypothetical protein
LTIQTTPNTCPTLNHTPSSPLDYVAEIHSRSDRLRQKLKWFLLSSFGFNSILSYILTTPSLVDLDLNQCLLYIDTNQQQIGWHWLHLCCLHFNFQVISDCLS